MKRCGRKRPWPNFKVLSQHLPGGTEKNHKNPHQYSHSPGRELSLGPTEHAAVMLTTLPRHSDPAHLMLFLITLIHFIKGAYLYTHIHIFVQQI
jgi:hypothetical protein